MIVQMLPLPWHCGNKGQSLRRHHNHLRDSMRTDAVPGWILYACLYYKLRNYQTTLYLLEFVLSRFERGMIPIRLENCQHVKHFYQHKFRGRNFC